MPIKPLALSAAAASRLRTLGKAPIVAHYRHGLEVLLGDNGTSDNDMLFISANGRGILPMHLVLRQRDFDQLMAQPAGTLLTFTRENSAASLEALPSLRLDTRIVHTFLPESTALPGCNQAARLDRTTLSNALTAVLHALQPLIDKAEPTGLGIPIDAMFDPQWRWRAAFETVARGTEGDAASAHLQAVRALLGRGQGATPAGDDMLLGALALQRALLPQPPLAATLTALNDELPQLTTTTSVAYLRWALRGIFGSHLLSLVRDIRDGRSNECIARRARRVARHGASSGNDTLLGLLLAGRALL